MLHTLIYKSHVLGMQNVMHKHLHLRPYGIQLLQVLKLNEHVRRTNFARDMLERIDATHNFLHQVCSSDDTIFNVTGVVNRYNCSIWGNKDLCVVCELKSERVPI